MLPWTSVKKIILAKYYFYHVVWGRYDDYTNLKFLVDHFKSNFVFPQFKQFQVQLPLHPKQLSQVTVLF